MTLHLTPLGIVCGALGGWIVLACLLAPRIGRAIKSADPGEDHEPDEPIEDRVVEARIRVQAELLVDEIAEYLAVQS